MQPLEGYSLKYFELRALGEPARYTAACMGRELEKDPQPYCTTEEIRGRYIGGQLPCADVPGARLSQSLAICWAVGAPLGMVPTDPLEQAKVIEFVNHTQEHTVHMRTVFQAPASMSAELRAKLHARMPSRWEAMEEVIRRNNAKNLKYKPLPECTPTDMATGEYLDIANHKGDVWVCNGKPSVADAFLYACLNCHPSIDDVTHFFKKGWPHEKFPYVLACARSFERRPGVQAYNKKHGYDSIDEKLAKGI